MFIILNSNFEIVEIKDNTFVANSSGYDNNIKITFKDNTFVDPTNIKGAEITFRRADDNIIGTMQMSKYLLPVTGQTYAYMWVYSITANDGVLFEKGTLGISIRFYDGTISNNILINKVTQGIAEVVAYVKQNVGQKDIEYYAQYEAQNTQEHQNLQSQITVNTNELTDHETRITQNTSNISSLTGRVGVNEGDIADLQTAVALLSEGENYVGEYPSQSTLPTDNELDAFVLGIAGRSPENGDVVLFTQIIPEQDRAYKYYFTNAGWAYYKLPFVAELATNSIAGLIQGTLELNNITENDEQFDIVGGKPRGIYVKVGSMGAQKLSVVLNDFHDTFVRIFDGRDRVASALQADKDGSGNVISNTYLDKVTGATKAWSDDRFMPKVYGQPYYYTSAGFATQIPTGTEPQFSVSATAGTIVFDIERTLEYDNDFNSKMSYSATVRPKLDTSNAVLSFRLTTYAKKITDVSWTTLAVEDSGLVGLEANVIGRIDFSSTFASLGSDVLDLEVGDKFRQVLEILSISQATSELLKFYCTENTPSLFILNTISNTINVNVINEPKKVSLVASDFTFDGEYYVATISPMVHLQPILDTYYVWGQVLKAGNIYQNEHLDYDVADGNIIIKKSAIEDIDIYIASGMQN